MRVTRLAAFGALACAAGLAFAGDIDLGIAQNDVWAYPSAAGPTTIVNAWGSFDVDLNPDGFPGPPPGSNFWSHIFVGWDTGAIPQGFRWGGATVTITLASDTWVPAEGDAYLRFLSGGFTEATWNITSNTPVPLPALGRITGDDAGATALGDTITFEIPASADRAVVFDWLTGGQVYLAITADNAPPPPGGGGEPGDLTGTLQVFSGEDVFSRGPRIVLHPGLLGDTNGDGAVDFGDLNTVLSDFNQSGEGLEGDLNRDGVVDFSDLNEVVSFFNT